MVNVENITKYYGNFLALDQVSFTFEKGDVVGLLGPNGAGKSTTMKILTGYMPPSEGKVSIQGFDVSESPIEIKKRIGFLPETAPLYVDMRVRDYLLYVSELKQVDSTKKKQFVKDAIEQTALKDVESKMIKTLSKGYRQRVGIAQALVAKPDLIILDEPTVGLDPKQVIEIRDLISDLAKDRTLLLSSHILSEVQAVCNKVVIMNKGKVVARETVTSLTTTPKVNVYELQVKSKIDWKSLRLNHYGIHDIRETSNGWSEFQVDDGKELHEIMKVLIDQKVPFTDLRKKEASLEDVYLQLVQEEGE